MSQKISDRLCLLAAVIERHGLNDDVIAVHAQSLESIHITELAFRRLFAGKKIRSVRSGVYLTFEGTLDGVVFQAIVAVSHHVEDVTLNA